MVIPNQSTNEGNQDPDPGRGGSADLGAGGAEGASHQPAENFEQRAPHAGGAQPSALKKFAEKISQIISPKPEKIDAPPEQASASPFLYGESELSAVTGIVLKSLQKKRATKLTQGVDWDLNGLRVAYSADGLVAIMAALTGKALEGAEIAGVKLTELQEKTRIPLPSAKKPEPGATAPPPGKGPDVRTGFVRRFFVNPYLMEVDLVAEPEDRKVTDPVERIPTTVEVITVRVKSTKNFRRGMAVPLRLDERSGRYELARRLPRFPGKW